VVPAVNNVIAAMKTERAPKRCRMTPVVGITTAIVNRNPVVTHCAVAAVIRKSTMRLGRATLMIVSLRITKNEATRSMPMTIHVCRVIGGSDGCGSEVFALSSAF
jgi:hypothetical protein